MKLWGGFYNKEDAQKYVDHLQRMSYALQKAEQRAEAAELQIVLLQSGQTPKNERQVQINLY